MKTRIPYTKPSITELEVRYASDAAANNRRPAGFLQEFFEQQYAKCSRFTPRKKFRFKNKLYSLDASVVDLCLSLFPWPRFRTTKGGIKLHALLDHDGYIPAFMEITDAKTADVTVAKTLKLTPFSIVVMDRAYVDFPWFERLTRQKVFFVTRLKRGIQYTVRQRRGVNGTQGVTSDQLIALTGPKSSKYHGVLHIVGYRDPETGQQ